MKARADSARASSEIKPRCLRQANSRGLSSSAPVDQSQTEVVLGNLSPLDQASGKSTQMRDSMTTSTFKRWRTRTTSPSLKPVKTPILPSN